MASVLVPALRLSRGKNEREHHMARHRRVKRERATVGWALRAVARPALPCTVTMTRIAPSAGLDDDNLTQSLSAVRDAVAEWLGVDDGDSATVRYLCAQERGPWSVRVTFAPAAEVRCNGAHKPVDPRCEWCSWGH